MPAEALKCKECRRGVRARGAATSASTVSGRSRSATTTPGSDDPAELRRKIQAGPPSIWRYSDFLPFERRPRTALDAGFTPLIRSERLAERLGVGEVYVKNDAANPTHSFKDRVVSVAIAKARELGFEVVACASTGNLANAVAAHAAAAGLDSYVFVPADLEEQKILATGVYGTQLVAVRGNYDDVNRLCTELSGEHPWAFVNVNLRPYYAEGSKTLAFEVAEQLGFELPDRVVCPVASGSLFTKIARGFEEWLELGIARGLAARLPRRPGRGLQPGGARPSTPATRSAGRCGPTRSPSRSRSATRPTACSRSSVARRTGGSIDSVTDEEIVEGIRLLAETTGIFTETAGGVTTAVLREARRARRHRRRRPRGPLHHRRGPEDARRRARRRLDLRRRADARRASPRRCRSASAGGACSWRSPSRSRRSCGP